MPQFHPYNVIDGYRSPRWVDPTPLAIIVRALFFFFGSSDLFSLSHFPLNLWWTTVLPLWRKGTPLEYATATAIPFPTTGQLWYFQRARVL